jgi:hypothetical protein
MIDNAMWTALCWQLTLTLLHLSAAGIVIGGIIIFANRLLRSASAHVRYWANYSAMILFVACLPTAMMLNRSSSKDIERVQSQRVSALQNSNNGSFFAEESDHVGDRFAAAVPPAVPDALVLRRR